MTGEKIRSLRKDNRPSKDEDLLEPDEEAATGTFSSSKANNKSRASKIFSNHKLIGSPSAPQQQNQESQINANTSDVVDDNNKNPIIRTGLDFPVHECVFKGDVRRLSSLIRTQNIAQKDVHGEFTVTSGLDSGSIFDRKRKGREETEIRSLQGRVVWRKNQPQKCPVYTNSSDLEVYFYRHPFTPTGVTPVISTPSVVRALTVYGFMFKIL